MYEAFYGLRRAPFSLSPDPNFLYLSQAHLEALSGLEYFLLSKASFCCLIGEPGLGKSTLASVFLDALDPGRHLGVFLTPAAGAFRDAAAAVVAAFGGRVCAADTAEALSARAREGVQALYRRGGRLVLVIDEAQLMPAVTLEAIRLFVDALSFGADPIKLILVGAPELERHLRTQVPALRQRMGVPLLLTGLGRKESIAYLETRIRQAGAAAAHDVLSTGALDAVADAAGGVPRIMNALANLVLVEGYADGERPVSRRAALTALRSARAASGRAPAGRAPGVALTAAAAVLVMIPALALSLRLLPPAHSRAPPSPSAPPAPVVVMEAEETPRRLPSAGLRGEIRPETLSVEAVASQAQGLKSDPEKEGGHHLAVTGP